MPIFDNRTDAGRKLADELAQRYGRNGTVVLALPRGGVPVAFEVAQALHAPLDVFIVRKLGYPGHEELAMGAIASGEVQVLNDEIVKQLHIPETALRLVAAEQIEELHRREHAYRGEKDPPEICGHPVILVDDGLATVATMRAAIAGLKKLGPSKVTVAVPVAAPDICESLEEQADEVICLATPEPFSSVGAWYRDFTRSSDDEVRQLLEDANAETGDTQRVLPAEKPYEACSDAHPL